MALKATRSKSLIIVKGKVLENESFDICVDDKIQTIQSISQNPVKFLGRTISISLTDKKSAEYLMDAVTKSDKQF